MTDLRQAAQQALEALEGWDNHGSWVWPVSALEQSKRNTTQAITALREALAQPEQEPVALDQATMELAESVGLIGPASRTQEPLEYWNAVEGWVKIEEVREHFDSVGCGTIYKAAGENRVPLYTAPPAAQRPWQGLTEKDWEYVKDSKGTSLDTFDQGAAWAANQLRRRNDDDHSAEQTHQGRPGCSA